MGNPILNFTEQGQGTPLFIIHGLFGSSRNWQSLAKRYAEDFRVISVDLRNHGDSFHDALMDYSLMAQDIVDVMDHLQLSTAHMLGHSMGGKVAMKLAHLYPQKVSKLVVADIAPVSYLHDYHELIDAAMNLDLSIDNTRKQIDDRLIRPMRDLLSHRIFQ